jgi:hypothetical protein
MLGKLSHISHLFQVFRQGRGELKVCGLDTISNLPVYHVQFRAWTTGFTKTLYPLDDKINILVR